MNAPTQPDRWVGDELDLSLNDEKMHQMSLLVCVVPIRFALTIAAIVEQ